jgi:hypothetical protein
MEDGDTTSSLTDFSRWTAGCLACILDGFRIPTRASRLADSPGILWRQSHRRLSNES